ncbi:MAG: hypothetical protein HWE39_21945 [Oceanospirillaceae bacterium]|nr:hypothetical protein [Oceanospirillaceae bacterium]
MARMARVVVPGYPHHVTQRGNRQQKTFFCDDEQYLLATVRYVERNPVVARLCREPADWEWCSAFAHLLGEDDGLVRVQPMLDRVSDWGAYLSSGNDEERQAIQQHSRTGRPLGADGFVQHLESVTGRVLAPGRSGPKAKA